MGAAASPVLRCAYASQCNVGLDQLIAETPEDYVRLATELADDLDRLAALRAGLRERMRRSPLMDAPGFTRRLEAAYQELSKTTFSI
jgi:predicted O-linked N-acetylglucosamine transferase (SPINDLY family)